MLLTNLGRAIFFCPLASCPYASAGYVWKHSWSDTERKFALPPDDKSGRYGSGGDTELHESEHHEFAKILLRLRTLRGRESKRNSLLAERAP